MRTTNYILLLGVALAAMTAWSCSSGPDQDDDGVEDSRDNCIATPNPAQEDTDGDGVGDACDNCPDISNEDQADADDDGHGDVCDVCPDVADEDQADTDQDGHGDACDNCLSVANPDQADSNNDQVGDACDHDEDGIRDDDDNCPIVANPEQTNSDSATGDTVGDECDPRPGVQDSILYFDGFGGERDLTDSGWTPAQGDNYVDGQWVMEDGALRHETIATDAPTLIYLAGISARNIRVEAMYTIDEIPQNADLVPIPYAGMVAVYSNGAAQDGGADTGHGCWQEKRNSTETRLSVSVLPDQFLNLLAPWDLESGQTYLSRFTQLDDGGGNTLTCYAKLDPQEFTNTLNDDTSFQGTIGFIANRVAVSFDYVLVYSLDGPAN